MFILIREKIYYRENEAFMKMFQYDGIDVSGGTGITSNLHDRIAFHCYYFFKINLRFQPFVCDACHIVM